MKSGRGEIRERLLVFEARIVGRGVEVAADQPGDCAQLSVSGLHVFHVRKELAHRFFADGDVLDQLAAVALQMHRVDEQQLLRRDLVGGEGEPARRSDRAAGFPIFRPRAHRLQAAGDRDLLRFRLSFARREVRADIDFESGERLDGERGAFQIAHFLQADDVGVEARECRHARL